MTSSQQPDCPECEKLSAVAKKSNEIGDFLGDKMKTNLTLVEATVYDNITVENGRDEVLNALREQDAQIKELIEIIQDYKEVTNVLGAGIGHIAVPDNFFGLWNETEIKASTVLRDAKVTK